ncbi:MAG: M23 family peptidase [Gammaproteobacteria bacterium]|nr:MAG: M23 family peptidase [Gammaproteobacteria bacterium]
MTRHSTNLLTSFALILFALSSFTPDAVANPAESTWLPREQRIPGGVALIDITSHYQPGMHVSFKGNPVKVEANAGKVVAIVGIPLSTGTKDAVLLLREGGPKSDTKTVRIPIPLQPGNYPKEELTIADTNKVSPDEESMRRIRRESKLIGGYLRNWQTEEVSFGPMLLPVDGRHSSSFGRRRVINGQPRRPHSGMDIAAPTGAPVLSPAAGVVSGGGDFFFNGNSLFIDHGEGVISMFCHLDEILVQPGEQVTQGQLVARVGSSGRVTGPHLHWSLSLNNARVDPMLFIPNTASENP